MSEEKTNEKAFEEVDETTEIKGTTDTTEEVVEASDETEALKQALSDKEDQVARLSAEIQNMRRRHQNERQDLAKYRSQSLGQNILPALDNLERALAIEVEGEASVNFKKGVEMVQQSLMQALEEEGIKEINPIGEIFDPNFHQSVSSVPKQNNQADEEIVEVYQKGYVLNDRVLRPAMVIIAQ